LKGGQGELKAHLKISNGANMLQISFHGQDKQLKYIQVWSGYFSHIIMATHLRDTVGAFFM